MSTMANRTRGAVPTRMAAAIAALSLLAMPVPAGAQGSGRTVLLTLTEGASLTQLADTVGALGGRVLATLELSDSLLVELPKGVGAPAGSAEIPDTPMRVNGTQQYYPTTEPTYRDTIGSPADPDLGKGVTVALIDTGVSPDADGLEFVEHSNFSGAEPGDGFGHGTFLAGIIGGRGLFPGVAPRADILDVQVADGEGNTSLSKVLTGLQFVADRDDVDVVNLSLSTKNPLPPHLDPLSRALERLWFDEGVTVVVAAGNDGPKAGSVGSPGDDPIVLTVGALDEIASADRLHDAVAEFSSRGDKYSVEKPDLVAPGVSLVSTAAPDSLAVTANPTSQLGNGYMRGSGTSMSAAVVSGAAAAVLSANPKLLPNGVKALLTRTTYGLDDSDGAGRGALDLGQALREAPSAAPDVPPVYAPGQPGGWGPSEDDAEAWAEFAKAWEAGDFEAVGRAWSQLSPRTRIWAGRAWSMAVLANSLAVDPEEFEARIREVFDTSAEKWLAQLWAGRAWSARDWSDDKWLGRAWSGRAWSDNNWLGRAWSGRAWSDLDWAGRAWSGRAWSGRAWSLLDWDGRAWSGRAWSGRAWSGRAWSGRAWSEYSWAARDWSNTTWSSDTWTLIAK
jgi:serine protease AprX